MHHLTYYYLLQSGDKICVMQIIPPISHAERRNVTFYDIIFQRKEATTDFKSLRWQLFMRPPERKTVHASKYIHIVEKLSFQHNISIGRQKTLNAALECKGAALLTAQSNQDRLSLPCWSIIGLTGLVGLFHSTVMLGKPFMIY